MKVVVLSTIVPFVDGGGTMIVDWLEASLEERGHEVEVLRWPFRSQMEDMAPQMVGMRLLNLDDACDVLVTIRWPAHVARHRRKVSWFIHHHRASFDLYDSIYRDVPPTPAGNTYRSMWWSADNRGLAECRRVYANSARVRDRLAHFNDVHAEVLYPPVLRPERFRNDGYGDSVLCVSRIVRHKRQDVLIEALARTRSDVRLVLAGRSGDDAYTRELRARVSALGLDERVTILDRWVSEEEKVDLLAGCLAVAYLPYDEDSYGYVSLEAHHAGKGVLTCTDSGGTLELIQDRRNGLVCAPDPESIGGLLDELYEDRALAERLGAAGEDRIRELGISWDEVAEKLLA